MQNVWISIGYGPDRSCWASSGLLRPNAEGHFALPGVGPGQYVLFGRGLETGGTPMGAPAPMPLWAETEFTLNGQDLSDLVMQFAPGSSITGRVVFQGAQPPPDPASLKISLTRAKTMGCQDPAPLPSATPSTDGTFVLNDRHGLRSPRPADTRIRGHRVPDRPCVVVDRPAQAQRRRQARLGRALSDRRPAAWRVLPQRARRHRRARGLGSVRARDADSVVFEDLADRRRAESAGPAANRPFVVR